MGLLGGLFGSKGMSFKKLENLIKSGQKQISLDSDVTFKEGSRDGIIISTENIVIDGNGHTIDANMKGIVFTLNAKNITIKNLKFKNGYSEECGAIYIRSNCTCRIENCTFEQNASSRGGIIVNFGQTTVKDCQILDNPTSAVSNQPDGNITLENTIISKNKAEYGAGIYNYGICRVENCTIQENSSNMGGGIINWGKILAKETKFLKNTATDNGGAIANDSGTITIKESTFEGNSSEHDGGVMRNQPEGKITIKKSLFKNNSSGKGGVFANFGKIDIEDSKIEENHADHAGVFSIQENGNITVKKSTISKNTADNGGVLSNFGKITIEDSLLEENSAKEYGGALLNSPKGTIIVDNCNFKNNTAQIYGAAILINDGGRLEISNSTLENNNAYGDDIYEGGVSIYVVNKENAKIENCKIDR